MTTEIEQLFTLMLMIIIVYSFSVSFDYLLYSLYMKRRNIYYKFFKSPPLQVLAEHERIKYVQQVTYELEEEYQRLQ